MNRQPQTTGLARAAARDPAPHSLWVALFMAVLIAKPSEWVPGMSVIPLTKITFVIALIMVLRGRRTLPSVAMMQIKPNRTAVLFLGFALFSVVFSVFKSASLPILQFATIVLLSVILVTKATHTRLELERLLTALCLVGLSLAIGVLGNYAGGRASINANFDPNDLAYTLVSLLPLVLAARLTSGLLRGWRGWGAAGLIVVAVLLTGSRGGLIGLGVVVVGAVLFPLGFSSSGQLLRPSVGRALLYTALAVGAATALWGHLPSETRERLATITDLQNDYNMNTQLQTSRSAVWIRNVTYALRRPIGFGIGTSAGVDGLAGGGYRAPHNSVVQAFVELGFIGLFLYLQGYVTAWRALSHLRREGAADAKIAADAERFALYGRALRMGLCANFASGFFLSQTYSATLWMMVAVCGILARLAPGAPAESQEPARRGPLRRNRIAPDPPS